MSIAPLDPAGVRFEDLPEQAWPRQEIIDGSLHVTPMASALHQVVVMRLCQALLARAPDSLQVLPGVNVLRRSDSDRLLIPDVAVVESGALDGGPVSVAPDSVYLAAEVISSSSRATDMYLKQQLYLEWGIGSYWVLDPATRTLHEFGPRDRAASWLSRVDIDSVWQS